MCVKTDLIILIKFLSSLSLSLSLSLLAESGAAKEAFSALAVLLYEAARVDADSASLK